MMSMWIEKHKNKNWRKSEQLSFVIVDVHPHHTLQIVGTITVMLRVVGKQTRVLLMQRNTKHQRHDNDKAVV